MKQMLVTRNSQIKPKRRNAPEMAATHWIARVKPAIALWGGRFFCRLSVLAFFAVILLAFEANAASYYQSYGSDVTENHSATSGSHYFEVDGIAWYKYTEWYVTGDGNPKETDYSGTLAIDPDFTWSISSGTTVITAVVYYDDWTPKETHKWIMSVDTSGPSNPTSFGGDSINTWTTDNDLDVSWSGASDSGTGLQKYYYKWSTSSSSSVTSSDSSRNDTDGVGSEGKDNVSDGLWYFHIRYVDNAGNWASSTKHRGPFKVDRTDPYKPNLKWPSNGTTIDDRTPKLDWYNTSDATSGVVQYKIIYETSAPFDERTKYSNSSDYQITENLSYNVWWYWRVYAKDAAGNWGPVSDEWKFKIADPDPTITRTTPSTQSVELDFGTTQQFTARARDDGDDLDRIVWSLTGPKTDTDTDNIGGSDVSRDFKDVGHYTFDEEGDYTLTATVYDDSEDYDSVSWSIHVNPEPKPDLIVTDIWVSKSTPLDAGGTVDVYAKVKNIGTAKANPPLSDFIWSQLKVNGQVVAHSNGNGLDYVWEIEINEERIYKFSGVTVPQAATMTCLAIPDANTDSDKNNRVAESSETNNDNYSEPFDVAQPGTITVHIAPSSAVATGRWKLTSGPDQDWHSSGDSVEVPVSGSPYTVTFNEISGWNSPSGSGAKPADITNVTVSSGSSAERTGTYRRITSAYWDESEKMVPAGTSVTMKAVVEGFADGTAFVFWVKENLRRDTYGPFNGTCSGGVVTAEWPAEWESDWWGDPDFYFTVSNATALADMTPTIVSRNSPDDLHVTPNPLVVEEHSPDGIVDGAPRTGVYFTFNEAIDPSSFTPADVVECKAPDGSSIDVVNVTQISDTQFRVTFSTVQSAAGTYKVVIGPNIADLAGNQMDQDEDGVKGEITDDQYTARFTIQPDFAPGVTVITHGYLKKLSGDVTQPPNWAFRMAEDVLSRANRLGTGNYGTILVNDLENGGWRAPTSDESSHVNTNNDSEEYVVVFNWASESDIGAEGWLAAAADSLFARLNAKSYPGGATGNCLLDKAPNLHFIGHSRGAVLNAVVIQKIGQFFPDIEIDQVTTIDPHPAHGILLTGFMDDPWYRSDTDNIVVPTFANVVYTDNYFRTDPGGYEWLVGRRGVEFGDFSGARTEGSESRRLNTAAGDEVLAHGWGSDREHTDIHFWYHGTIMYGEGLSADGLVMTAEMRHHSVAGVSAYIDEGFNEGYARSRIAGKVNRRLEGTGHLGGGAAPRTSLPLLSSTVLLENGNFETATAEIADLNVSRNFPGWDRQGGEGDAPIRGENGLLSGNRYLSLQGSFLGPYELKRTHNPFYIPANASSLRFKMWVVEADEERTLNVDRIEVLIGDKVKFSEYLNVADADWGTRYVPVSDYQNSVQTVTFRILDQNGGTPLLNSEVWIDDVELILDVDNPPAINHLSDDSPDPVYRPNNVTLTCTGVTDDHGVVRVKFWRDNGNGVFNEGEETPVGEDTTIVASTASVSPSTSGWPVGTVKCWAVAYDTADQPSAAVSIDVHVAQYTLTYAVEEPGWGSITETPPAGDYDDGTVVNPKANPNSGYAFVRWEANGATETMPITLHADTHVVAVFRDIRRHLTVNNGTGTGDYEPGTGVIIRANGAPTGKHFVEWTSFPLGIVFPTDTESAIVTMPNDDALVTATYDWNDYTVVFDIGDGTRTGGGALTQRVRHGLSAAEPQIQPPTGYQHFGWDQDFTNVTSDLPDVNAIYIPDGSGATRTVNGNNTELVTVQIDVTPPPGTGSYSVDDLISSVPAGLSVTGITVIVNDTPTSDPGEWDAVHHKVKFGPFLDDTARTLTYQLSAPGGPHTLALTGTASFDGNGVAVTGDSPAVIQNGMHFSSVVTGTGDTHTLIIASATIDGVSLVSGEDEIGVYDLSGVKPDGTNGPVLVAAGKWESNLQLSAVISVDLGEGPLPGAASGHSIAYRIWDASAGEEYPDQSIDVTYDGATPTFGSGLKFNTGIQLEATGITEQTISLRPNFLNAISLGVSSATSDPGTVFAEGLQDVLFVRNDDGEVYVPAGATAGNPDNPIGSLLFEPERGYIIALRPGKQQTDIAVTGTRLNVSERLIPLRPSFLNLVAFPFLESRDLEDAVSKANRDKIRFIRDHDGAVYVPAGATASNPDSPIGNLLALTPGNAYQFVLRGTENVNFQYENTSRSRGRSGVANERTPRALEHFADVVDATGDSHTLIISAATIGGVTLEQGEDEIAVYDLNGIRPDGSSGEVLVAAGKWQPNLTLSVVLSVDLGEDVLPGAVSGNSIVYRIWDKNPSNTEYGEGGITVVYPGSSPTFGSGLKFNADIQLSVDLGAPTIIDAALGANNMYVDITFSEGVFGDSSATQSVQLGDFDIELQTQRRAATEVTITNVTKTDGVTAVEAGDTEVRLYLNVEGAEDGTEQIRIKPADAASIYDANGNPMAADEASDWLTLDPDDAPTVANSIPDVNANEDAADQQIDLTNVFTDVDDPDDAIVKSAESSDETLVTVTVVDNTLTLDFQPDANGSATITVTGTSNGKSVNDEFTVTVAAVNDAPVFTKGLDQAVNEDEGLQTVANWVTNIAPGPPTATDETGQTVTFTVNNDNNAVFSVQPAITANGTLTYTPTTTSTAASTDVGHGPGVAKVNVTAVDNGGIANGGENVSGEQTFLVTITPVNDPPVITQVEITPPAQLVNGGNITATVTATDEETSSARTNNIWYKYVWKSGTKILKTVDFQQAKTQDVLTEAEQQTLADGGTPSDLGDNYPVIVEATVRDDSNPPGETTDSTSTYVGNQPPTLDWTGTSASPVSEGETIQISVAASDVGHTPQEDDIVSITIKVDGEDKTADATVVLTGTTGTLTYSIPTDNNTSSHTADKTYSVEVTATDAFSASTETHQIAVTDVNTRPEIGATTVAITKSGGTGVGGAIGTQDAVTATITPGATDADTEDTGNLQYRFVWSNASRAELRNQVVDGVQDTLPANGYGHGSVITVTVTAVDTKPEDSVGNVADSVTIANTAPVATNDPDETTNEDATLTFDPRGNDNDADDDTLTIIGLPTNVSVSSAKGAVVTTDGTTVTYDPRGFFDFLGNGEQDTDTFTYAIADGQGADDTATVTVTITGVNDPPTARPDSYYTPRNEQLVVTASGVLANDTDPDSVNLQAVLFTDVDKGVLDLNGDGSFTYTPPLDYTGVARFSYTADDGTTPSEAVEVMIVIGSPPWYPLIPLPAISGGGIVRVTITDVDTGNVVLRGRRRVPAGGAPAFFRPEDYRALSGPARQGLLPGTYRPTFAIWDQDAGVYGEPTDGAEFPVAYDEPVAPTDLAVTPVDGDNPNRDFRFNIDLAQGFVLEVTNVATGQVVGGRADVVAFGRPAKDAAFPVSWPDTKSFIKLLPKGTYDWRVRAYNPLVPVDDASRAENWANGPQFVVGIVGPCTTAPAAPPTNLLLSEDAGFVADGATATVDFSWDPVENAVGYFVYVGTMEGRTIVNRRRVTEPQLNGVLLRPGLYRWAVSAYNLCGTTDWSSPPVEFTVRSDPATGLPGEVTAGTVDTAVAGDVTFTWDWTGLEGDSVTLMIVNASTQQAVFERLLDPTQATLSGDFAEAGMTYFYKTRGVNANGSGPWSAWGRYTMPGDENVILFEPVDTGAAPETNGQGPADVDTAVAGNVTFVWNWTGAAAPLVRMRIMRGDTFVFAMENILNGAGETVQSYAEPGVTYHFQCRPLNIDGSPAGPWSEWDKYTP